VGELYNLGARFDANLSDPCNLDVNPVQPANCAALGVPPDYVQTNPQISVDTGGNRGLQPETSETFTAGFTWDIPMGGGGIEHMLFEANYYDISIDDAIQAPASQQLIDSCVATLDPQFCDHVNRTALGAISSVEGQLQNIGGIETDGFDINFNVTTAETGVGRFDFQLMGSFLLNYDELRENFTTGGFDRTSLEGREVGSPTRGYVEDKITLNTQWTKGDWSALLSFRYLSSLTENCVGNIADFGLNDPNGTNLCSDPTGLENKLDSQVYTDLQVGWQPTDLFGGGWSFALGVQNLTDETPPICYSCDLNSLDGQIYPIAGQFWYVRASFTK
jgi:iron complex outermembrane receptor protein